MGQSIIQKNLKSIDLCRFKYPELLQKLSLKQALDFSKLKNECVLIGEGCAAKIYLCKKLNIVFKIIKNNPNPEDVVKEILAMEKVNSIWPDIFQYLVVENDAIVGFSMKYFQGQKIWQAYTDPGNIYYRNPSSRVRLVKKVKEYVKRLQQLMIGHGDLHVDNIMIKQKDKTKEDCQILIIDYGLAFTIDDYGLQKPGLTGWAFMKPSEAKTEYFYNTLGLNAYMFGRVALQILLLQTYNDYSHCRNQSPEEELNCLARFGFDPSVKEEIERYLDKDIGERNKALLEESRMKEEVVERVDNNNNGEQAIKVNIGWSMLNLIANPHQWDENYYVRHPEKLGYKK